MEFNLPSEVIKQLDFGEDAESKVLAGVSKLAAAVKTTLGASGKCVIYEDARGKPVITKDGVTVAESVILRDPVENMGASLIKQAARKTVSEAGDGTTTATVLAEALIKQIIASKKKGNTIREIKDDITRLMPEIMKQLDEMAIEVSGDMLEAVSTISTNGDAELGKIIADAYESVGQYGAVIMETSETDKTYASIVDGAQIDSGLTSPYFITNKDKSTAELQEPYVLTVATEIPSLRKIENVLKFVIDRGAPLLIVAPVSDVVKKALLMNNVKGNIKVNVIEPPGFGPTRKDALEDIAVLTGSTVISEELGDDLELIQPEHLGQVVQSVTDSKTTVFTLFEGTEDNVEARIEDVQKKIAEEKNGFIKKKLEQRLATLSGSVGVVRVGANSDVELKEKKDRVEDAIYATKAAIKEGIVPGGGIALFDVSEGLTVTSSTPGAAVLKEALLAPYRTILENAHLEDFMGVGEGFGIDASTGELVEMVASGIIDPVLVTKTALKNAVSVATTITSADCVISNVRVNEGSTE